MPRGSPGEPVICFLYLYLPIMSAYVRAVQHYVVECFIERSFHMRVTIAKKIAHENGMSLEYNNDMRLYILKDEEQGWPDQFFPGSALRTMDNDVFMSFFLRIKD